MCAKAALAYEHIVKMCFNLILNHLSQAGGGWIYSCVLDGIVLFMCAITAFSKPSRVSRSSSIVLVE